MRSTTHPLPGVNPLRRWVAEGIVPLRDGEWTPAAVAQARIVARLRQRGHDLGELRTAAKEGRPPRPAWVGRWARLLGLLE